MTNEQIIISTDESMKMKGMPLSAVKDVHIWYCAK
jgi:hypothetical protein